MEIEIGFIVCEEEVVSIPEFGSTLGLDEGISRTHVDLDIDSIVNGVGDGIDIGVDVGSVGDGIFNK